MARSIAASGFCSWRSWPARHRAARATYLGAVRAGSLQHAAATQQVTNVTIPAPRGTITDRNGVELAISESADDIVADPYLIKNPVDGRATAGAAARQAAIDGADRR